jgi:hypothetical protein
MDKDTKYVSNLMSMILWQKLKTSNIFERQLVKQIKSMIKCELCNEFKYKYIQNSDNSDYIPYCLCDKIEYKMEKIRKEETDNFLSGSYADILLNSEFLMYDIDNVAQKGTLKLSNESVSIITEYRREYCEFLTKIKTNAYDRIVGSHRNYKKARAFFQELIIHIDDLNYINKIPKIEY